MALYAGSAAWECVLAAPKVAPSAECAHADPPIPVDATGAGAMPTGLILGYGPSWMKPSIYGQKPAQGLTAMLLAADRDEETKELLGVSGWMEAGTQGRSVKAGTCRGRSM